MLTVELQDIVREHDGTFCQAWVAIEDLFLGNREVCALHLDATFWAFVQGELNVNDYCRKMKGMTDALYNPGEPVPVLSSSTFFGVFVPFPSFRNIHNDLLLEEITIIHEATSDSATTFIAFGESSRARHPPIAPPVALVPLPPLVVVVGVTVVADAATTIALGVPHSFHR
jgi:hypothetical protein